MLLAEHESDLVRKQYTSALLLMRYSMIVQVLVCE